MNILIFISARIAERVFVLEAADLCDGKGVTMAETSSYPLAVLARPTPLRATGSTTTLYSPWRITGAIWVVHVDAFCLS